MKTNEEKTIKKPKIAKPLIIFISVFLILVMAFGITFGVIAYLRNKNATVYYDGLTMDTEVASFFASYYKSVYMGLLRDKANVENVSDTITFWYSEYEDGKTYKDALTEATAEYLKRIMVSNYLFDNYTSLNKEGKNFIQSVIDTIVTDRAGSVASFNEKVKPYGFSYDSFSKAVTMLYKAEMASSAIYGSEGENLMGFSSLCEEFLGTYSHVKLLIIRTENELVVDEDGQFVINNGIYETRPLSDTEKAERAESIEAIRASIVAYNNGTDAQMTPEYFNSMLTKYDNEKIDFLDFYKQKNKDSNN